MKNRIAFILAVLVLMIFNSLIYLNIFASPSQYLGKNSEFPYQVGDWIGEEVPYDKEVLSVLSADEIIYRNYIFQKSPPITLFIANYDTLEKADLSHSPIVCFTGQGWEITESSEKEIASGLEDGPKIRVNQLTQKKSDAAMITFFWYQSADGALSNRGFHKIQLFLGKMFGKADRNAFVRVTVSVPPGRSVQEMTSYLNIFVLDLYPQLKNYIL